MLSFTYIFILSFAQLYILLNNEEIVLAFVLSNTNSGKTAVKWNDNHAKAVYIDRLGVNVKYSKKILVV